MAESLGQAVLELDADATPLDRKLDRTEAATQARIATMSGRMRAAGSRMAEAGMLMTRNLTLPILAVGGAAGKLAMDFDTSMQRIIGLVGASQQQVDAWSKQLLQLGPEVGKSPQELADALFFVASAGFEGAAAMDVVLASAKASAAGLGDTATIADAVTSAIGAYGKENITAAQATDILTAAVKEGKLEAEDLAPAIGRVLPLAAQLGVDFAQVGGTLASMSRTGLDANESVTALRGILGKLIKPTQQAKDVLAEYGLSAQEVREQVREKGLLATLRDLDRRFGDNEEAMGKVFEDVEGLVGVLNLLGQDAKTVDGIMRGVAESTGAADEAFEAAQKTARFKLDAAMSELKASLIILGSTVLPPVTSAFSTLARLVGRLGAAFGELSPRTRTTILIVAGLAAALGPVILLVGKLITAIGFLAANPIVALIAIVALLAIVIVRHWDEIKSKTLAVWGAIRDFLGKVWGGIKGVAETTLGALKRAFSSAWTKIKDAVITAVVFILKAFDRYLAGIEGILHVMGKLPGPLGAPFRAMEDAVEKARRKVGELQGTVNSLHSKTIRVTAVVSGLGSVAALAEHISLVQSRTVSVGVARRQHGGPVTAGRAFLVGEAGPEVFVPRVGGRIVPNMGGLGAGPVFVRTTVEVDGQALLRATRRAEREFVSRNGGE